MSDSPDDPLRSIQRNERRQTVLQLVQTGLQTAALAELARQGRLREADVSARRRREDEQRSSEDELHEWRETIAIIETTPDNSIERLKNLILARDDLADTPKLAELNERIRAKRLVASIEPLIDALRETDKALFEPIDQILVDQNFRAALRKEYQSTVALIAELQIRLTPRAGDQTWRELVESARRDWDAAKARGAKYTSLTNDQNIVFKYLANDCTDDLEGLKNLLIPPTWKDDPSLAAETNKHMHERAASFVNIDAIIDEFPEKQAQAEQWEAERPAREAREAKAKAEAKIQKDLQAKKVKAGILRFVAAVIVLGVSFWVFLSLFHFAEARARENERRAEARARDDERRAVALKMFEAAVAAGDVRTAVAQFDILSLLLPGSRTVFELRRRLIEIKNIQFQIVDRSLAAGQVAAAAKKLGEMAAIFPSDSRLANYYQRVRAAEEQAATDSFQHAIQVGNISEAAIQLAKVTSLSHNPSKLASLDQKLRAAEEQAATDLFQHAVEVGDFSEAEIQLARVKSLGPNPSKRASLDQKLIEARSEARKRTARVFAETITKGTNAIELARPVEAESALRLANTLDPTNAKTVRLQEQIAGLKYRSALADALYRVRAGQYSEALARVNEVLISHGDDGIATRAKAIITALTELPKAREVDPAELIAQVASSRQQWGDGGSITFVAQITSQDNSSRRFITVVYCERSTYTITIDLRNPTDPWARPTVPAPALGGEVRVFAQGWRVDLNPVQATPHGRASYPHLPNIWVQALRIVPTDFLAAQKGELTTLLSQFEGAAKP